MAKMISPPTNPEIKMSQFMKDDTVEEVKSKMADAPTHVLQTDCALYKKIKRYDLADLLEDEILRRQKADRLFSYMKNGEHANVESAYISLKFANASFNEMRGVSDTGLSDKDLQEVLDYLLENGTGESSVTNEILEYLSNR